MRWAGAALVGLVALVVAACGDPLVNFVGVWAYDSGSTTTTTCGSDAPVTAPLVGDFTLGRDGPRLTSPGANGCPDSKLDVAGNTATLEPFTCSTTANGTTTTTNYRALTIHGNGPSMTLDGSGDYTTDSPAKHCTFTISASATKN